MLNELYTIYLGLESIGESPEIKHNDIQEPGANNTTFRVMLDHNGQVSSVRLMTKEQIQHCWSLGNNQSQFPAVKVKRPLYAAGHEEYLHWKDLNRRPVETEYRNFIECMSHLYYAPIQHCDIWPAYRNRILERTKNIQNHSECKEIYELFKRYSQAATGVEILDQVTRVVTINALQNADLTSLKAICALLFGEKLKASGEVEDNKRITLLLDCFPSTDVDVYATSKEHVSSLSRALFADEEQLAEKSNNGMCALSGQVEQLVGEKFPKEKLAVVGPTIIFAKNEDTSGRTVERYGQAKGKAYPLSRSLSQKLAAGISFLTSDKFKNKTWAKLPSSSLLLAYCQDDHNLAVTPLITGESEVEDLDDYLDVTESVLASFRGTELFLDASVDFFEIIKVDKANRKINFSTTAKIKKLIQAAEDWQKTCINSPDFKLLAQVRKKTRQMCTPWAVSPLQVMSLSKKKYIRNGYEMTPVPGISFADAMKLFLGKQRPDWMNNCLRHIAVQYQPLFRYCALSKLQKILPAKSITVKTSPRYNAQALSAVTLISVLLYRTGRTKEVYMKDFAYQLGQLCAAMDEVHIGYCVSERGGSIPNTLLGNQVYGMALQDPVKAMGFMASRRRPYDSWIKRLRYNKEKDSSEKAVINARYAQNWMGKQAKKLKQNLLDAHPAVSDSYKAELMLGYLAGRPFTEKKTTAQSNNEKGEAK
jgi:hypothetical protein